MFVAVCDHDFRDLDVFLPENHLPFFVADLRRAPVPFHLVEGRNPVPSVR